MITLLEGTRCNVSVTAQQTPISTVTCKCLDEIISFTQVLGNDCLLCTELIQDPSSLTRTNEMAVKQMQRMLMENADITMKSLKEMFNIMLFEQCKNPWWVVT